LFGTYPVLQIRDAALRGYACSRLLTRLPAAAPLCSLYVYYMISIQNQVWAQRTSSRW